MTGASAGWAAEAALRAYPRSWREDGRIGEMREMLAGSGCTGRVAPAEFLGLLGNAFFARAGSRAHQAVRVRVARLSLATGLCLAVALFVMGEWLPLAPIESPGAVFTGMLGPFTTTGSILDLGWVLMAGCVWWAPRWAAWASTLAVITVLPVAVVVIPWVSSATRPSPFAVLPLVLLGIGVAGGLDLGAFRPRRAWPAVSMLLAAAASFAILCDMSWASEERQGFSISKWGGLASLADWVPASIAVIAIAAALAWHWDRAWLPAVAWTALPWAVLALRSAPTDDRGTLGLLVAAVSLACALTATVLTLASRRGVPTASLG